MILLLLAFSALYIAKKVDLTLEYRDLLLDVTKPLTELHAQELYSKFTKIYQKSESNDGLKNFKDSLKKIIEHNQNPLKTYTKGINQFSDMSFEDFKNFYLMKEPQNCSATGNFKFLLSDKNIPEKVDWRNRGGVSPVKSQGHCGSCWTFSTVGSMESHYLIYKHKQIYFAEQQLVDCAGDFDNHGCNGGLPSHAFEYIKYNGITTEDQYPYQAKELGKCNYTKDMAEGYALNGSFNITAGDEETLTKSLAQVGPVSIAFQVVDGFKDYRDGVYTSDVCKGGPKDVNHAVLAVGYGVCKDSGLDYYIVKNSWGTEWGNDGYFLIQRGNNMCGVSQCNSFPDLGQTGIERIQTGRQKGILKMTLDA